MNYRLHENGWTVILEDFDLRTATQDDVNEIARLIAKYTVVVAKNQTLSIQDEVRVINMFKDPEVPNETRNGRPNGGDGMGLIVPDSEGKIARVTGEKDELGRPGLFGHVSDLDWHCNSAANPWRKPIVWLYSIKGSKGSKTSWINHALAYDDLSAEDKERFKTIRMINGYKRGSYSEHHFGKDIDINFEYKPNLVHTNIAGVTGLFFPFLQIHQIDGMTEEESMQFIQNLRQHVEQEKYMYHHDWDDGDLVISEQWLGVHKRWRFEAIETRVLHRATMDFPDQQYC